MNWLDSVSHHRWLGRHRTDLLDFGRTVARENGGAYWLDSDGQPDLDEGVHTWITARTLHVFGLGSLLGTPGCRRIAQLALDGLRGPLHDAEHGGWFSHLRTDGESAPGKSCYDHAFVTLASTTACHAELDGSHEVMQEASNTFTTRFWDESAGLCHDYWDTPFEQLEHYRGLNANMHGVEAMLSLAGLTHDPVWLERAGRICAFVAAIAEDNKWRIPEHYDADWNAELDYHIDRPDDRFKPYGATVGHAFEWARLFVHLANAPAVEDAHTLVRAAERLFDQAVTDGWERDGHPGFVYTTDWDGTPVVSERMHWVLAEAIGAAAVLGRHTGEARYGDWYRRLWDHAADFYVDPDDGSWLHQLDQTNRPANSVWHGKPDLYHAFQATLIPTQPLYPMLGASVAEDTLSAM